MKTMILALLFTSTAFAQDLGLNIPDFRSIVEHEKKLIAKDSGVKAYVTALGAKKFEVKSGDPSIFLYAVETDNNCSFDVEIVYKKWPKIEKLLVYPNAICR